MKMTDEMIDSIWEAAEIAEEESRILDEEYFEEHEFEIYLKPNGTIRLLRESEYFAKIPEGWEKINYDGHSNDDLTFFEGLQEIVEEWLEKNGKED